MSQSIKKGFQNVLFENSIDESFMGISDSKISFLSLSKKEKKADLYSNTKNIPFNKLNPEFQKILIEEFTDFPL
jgi:hypothetical protein